MGIVDDLLQVLEYSSGPSPGSDLDTIEFITVVLNSYKNQDNAGYVHFAAHRNWFAVVYPVSNVR
jgi:hypothetical protein